MEIRALEQMVNLLNDYIEEMSTHAQSLKMNISEFASNMGGDEISRKIEVKAEASQIALEKTINEAAELRTKIQKKIQQILDDVSRF